jgi:hypothetical protein
MKTNLADGLYQVATSSFVAGFEVKEKEIVACAPILKAHRNLGFWLCCAKKVEKINETRKP